MLVNLNWLYFDILLTVIYCRKASAWHKMHLKGVFTGVTLWIRMSRSVQSTDLTIINSDQSARHPAQIWVRTEFSITAGSISSMTLFPFFMCVWFWNFLLLEARSFSTEEPVAAIDLLRGLWERYWTLNLCPAVFVPDRTGTQMWLKLPVKFQNKAPTLWRRVWMLSSWDPLCYYLTSQSRRILIGLIHKIIQACNEW